MTNGDAKTLPLEDLKWMHGIVSRKEISLLMLEMKESSAGVTIRLERIEGKPGWTKAMCLNPF